MSYLRSLLLLFSFIGLLGNACHLLGQQTFPDSIVHDGMFRSFLLYVPASYTGQDSVPLLLNYHGYGSNSIEQMLYGDFRPLADSFGFILVQPQGMPLNGVFHWNVGGWTVGSTIDDIGFTSDLIDTLAARYTIDTDRVYSTGMSNGGFMSYQLACQLGDKIAAIASVTGSMTPEIFNDCTPAHPTPILQIHGTVDPVIPYNGNFFSKSMDEILTYWKDFNQCNDTATTVSLPNLSQIDGSTVERITYDGGLDGTVVEHLKITGGAHTWPGTVFISAGTNLDIDGSAEIWAFLSQYELSSFSPTTSVEPEQLASDPLQLYPNPTKGMVRLAWDQAAPRDLLLTDLSGKILLREKSLGQQHALQLDRFPAGIYVLQVGGHFHKIVREN
ncbi:MAG: T9SS type A sorting domain-containing protein [Bacteroidota bacterium]